MAWRRNSGTTLDYDSTSHANVNGDAFQPQATTVDTLHGQLQLPQPGPMARFCSGTRQGNRSRHGCVAGCKRVIGPAPLRTFVCKTAAKRRAKANCSWSRAARWVAGGRDVHAQTLPATVFNTRAQLAQQLPRRQANFRPVLASAALFGSLSAVSQIV